MQYIIFKYDAQIPCIFNEHSVLISLVLVA